MPGKRPRASLGVALMARDASETLARCLDSIRPYVQQIVVGVDTLTKDRTAQVARKHGADLVFPLTVSREHTCDDHGTVLAQHFAEARNETFRRLDPTLDWHAWLDADDVVRGAEHLPALLGATDPRVIGYWLNYEYGHSAGKPNTVFRRERILRASVGWQWEQRVHEVVKPLSRQGDPWAMNDDVVIVHQDRRSTANSVARNQLLLEIDLEENPNDPRAWFYLGNGHFAVGRWAEAAEAYQHLLQIDRENTYQRWQAAVYLSLALEKLGDLNGALDATDAALHERPEHPEPYFRKAALYGLAGQDDKVVFWTKLGRQMQEPPFFVFKNPLDYTFNPRTVLGDAYARMGKLPEALGELETAYSVIPDAKLGEAIKHYREVQAQSEQGHAFVQTAKLLPEETRLSLYEALPRGLKQMRSVRDVAIPALLRQRPNTQPRIVFWCGRSYEEWAPPTLNETGIGGSETAVVEIARRFAQDGWRVDVYNGAGSLEGEYDGVGYWDPERWRTSEESVDVYVSWRQPRAWAPGFYSVRARVLWCHDLNYGPLQTNPDLVSWDKVLGVSQWHADYLRSCYGLSEDRVDFVPNGIDLSRFGSGVRKQPWTAVYASSPDRGLSTLLRLWRRIAEGEPQARLRVAYGWNNVDKLIANGRSDLAAFKDAMTRLMEQTPGVEFLGRLPQNELARLYEESWVWAYPTGFLEVSCISAMEAMAGGAVPITSAAGALKETIGKAGVVIPGLPHSPAWHDFYVHAAQGVFREVDVAKPLQYAARERAKGLTWDAAYARWVSITAGLLEGKKEAACV